MFLGVALLPFVDEKRLLTSLAKVYPDLNEDESKDSFNLRLFETKVMFSLWCISRCDSEVPRLVSLFSERSSILKLLIFLENSLEDFDKQKESVEKIYISVSERRNSRGKDRLFVGPKHPAFDFFKGLYETDGGDNVRYCTKDWLIIDWLIMMETATLL